MWAKILDYLISFAAVAAIFQSGFYFGVKHARNQSKGRA